MINCIKKSPDITLKSEARFSSVARYASGHKSKNFDSLVGSKSDPARKGTLNKCWFKDRINYRKNSVVENSVTNGGLMNVSWLWITDIKTSILPVFIGFILEFSVKFKNIFLKTIFKFLDVNFASFVVFESI